MSQLSPTSKPNRFLQVLFSLTACFIFLLLLPFGGGFVYGSFLTGDLTADSIPNISEVSLNLSPRLSARFFTAKIETFADSEINMVDDIFDTITTLVYIKSGEKNFIAVFEKDYNGSMTTSNFDGSAKAYDGMLEQGKELIFKQESTDSSNNSREDLYRRALKTESSYHPKLPIVYASNTEEYLNETRANYATGFFFPAALIGFILTGFSIYSILEIWPKMGKRV